MSKIDYCVTTMDRPHVLERLLSSVAAHRPDASVHIADQSANFDPIYYDELAERLEQAGLRRRSTVHRLPFDCGVSAARNHLMDSTPGDYKLLLDDDFVFTERTDIDSLVRLLDAEPRAGAAGGAVSRNGEIRNVGTLLRNDGATLHQLLPDGELDELGGVRYVRTDCVPIFVLMRKELAAHVQWDPELKTAGEHFDFFLRMRQTPYSVLYTPDVVVDHPPATTAPTYKQLRMRGDFLKLMLPKHGLTRLVSIDGVTTELCSDGELIRYCRLDLGARREAQPH